MNWTEPTVYSGQTKCLDTLLSLLSHVHEKEAERFKPAKRIASSFEKGSGWKKLDIYEKKQIADK